MQSVTSLYLGEVLNFVREQDESGNYRKLGQEVGRKKQTTHRNVHVRFHFLSYLVHPHPGEFLLVFGTDIGSRV